MAYMGMQVLHAEKILIGTTGLDRLDGEGVALYNAGIGFGLGLSQSETGDVVLGNAINLPNEKIVKSIKVFVNADSSKKINVFLFHADKYGVLGPIASKSDITGLGPGTQKIVLDMIESGHIVNTKKYEYVLVIEFEDGGDDDALVFYSMKIRLV